MTHGAFLHLCRFPDACAITFSNDLFRKCLMSLSADAGYADWLVGRKLGDRDRSPAYSRIKQIFTGRIMDELKVDRNKVFLPQPPWMHSSGHSGGRP